MSEPRPVAVLVNGGTSAAELAVFQRVCPHPCVMFAVTSAETLQRAVRGIYATGSATYEAVVNLCVDEEDAPEGVTAALASVFLEQCALPYTGCRSKALNYPLDIMMMMLYYAGMPLPPFAIIDSEAAARRAAQTLHSPVHVRNACALLGRYETTCSVQASLEETLLRALQTHGKVVAWQLNASAERAMRVVVAGGSVKGAAAVVPMQPTSQPPAWWGTAEAAARTCAAALNRFVLYDCGVAALTLNTLPEEPERWCFQNLTLNPPVGQMLQDAAANLLQDAPTPAELVAALVAEARARHPEPTFAIRLHSDSRKGFHLCAARALKKGDIVFEDECRAFAVVTRPHVERHWDARLKKMFTEYAWPLDSDGHLYAIWEEDPQRWRPINHSCDPNCIFTAPHSLNVIAARDVAAGEDLTMDYATFCDRTMKPFQCLCGATCCRGLISPDAASLEKYGENAWLRKVPPEVQPLLPS